MVLTKNKINDMILAGKSPSEIIKKNTFNGLQAKVKLTEWKRV